MPGEMSSRAWEAQFRGAPAPARVSKLGFHCQFAGIDAGAHLHNPTTAGAKPDTVGRRARRGCRTNLWDCDESTTRRGAVQAFGATPLSRLEKRHLSRTGSTCSFSSNSRRPSTERSQPRSGDRRPEAAGRRRDPHHCLGGSAGPTRQLEFWCHHRRDLRCGCVCLVHGAAPQERSVGVSNLSARWSTRSPTPPRAPATPKTTRPIPLGNPAEGRRRAYTRPAPSSFPNARR